VSYDIPNFVKVDYNEAERVANLEVEDSGIRKQKEMWGTCSPSELSFLVYISC